VAQDSEQVAWRSTDDVNARRWVRAAESPVGRGADPSCLDNGQPDEDGSALTPRCPLVGGAIAGRRDPRCSGACRVRAEHMAQDHRIPAASIEGVDVDRICAQSSDAASEIVRIDELLGEGRETPADLIRLSDLLAQYGEKGKAED